VSGTPGRTRPARTGETDVDAVVRGYPLIGDRLTGTLR